MLIDLLNSEKILASTGIHLHARAVCLGKGFLTSRSIVYPETFMMDTNLGGYSYISVL